MLVLTRKKGQSIMIGHEIEVVVLEVRGEQVRLGIRAKKTFRCTEKKFMTSFLQVKKKVRTNFQLRGGKCTPKHYPRVVT